MFFETALCGASKVYHHPVSLAQEEASYEWTEEGLESFQELIVTWNGDRPREGYYSILVSLKIEEWTPWLLYAEWGEGGQKSFRSVYPEFAVQSFQDAVETIGEKKAKGFKVRIEAKEGAGLSSLFALHASTNLFSSGSTNSQERFEQAIDLSVVGLSQMAISHPRHKDLCSPTSTTAVVRYLTNRLDVDPISFAAHAWDGGWDIYGNWVFNVAHASSLLGRDWQCWVQRLNHFSELYAQLGEGFPVVVSVRGPLPGSASSYAHGHLIVVTGFDASTQEVLCMDPGFETDEKTVVRYPLAPFISAWERRGRIAYLIRK